MTSLADSIRSFGMSGLLICDELRQIEQSYPRTNCSLLSHAGR